MPQQDNNPAMTTTTPPLEPKRSASLLTVLMRIIYLLAALIVPAAWGLAVWAGPFRGRIIMIALFSLICIERIWAMMFRMPKRNSTESKGDWTACTVGLSNVLVQYGMLAEFLWVARDRLSIPISIVGGLVYLTGLALRHGALHHLAEQWTVQLDQKIEGQHLIRSGPYGWIRHPIYTAACTELIGVAILFNAPFSLLGALLLFVPAEIQRARFEEQFLRRDFGDEYDVYATQVPGFLPRLRRK